MRDDTKERGRGGIAYDDTKLQRERRDGQR